MLLFLKRERGATTNSSSLHLPCPSATPGNLAASPKPWSSFLRNTRTLDGKVERSWFLTGTADHLSREFCKLPNLLCCRNRCRDTFFHCRSCLAMGSPVGPPNVGPRAGRDSVF